MTIQVYPQPSSGYASFGGYIAQGKYGSASDSTNQTDYVVNVDFPAGPYEVNLTAGSYNYIQVGNLAYGQQNSGTYVVAWSTGATSYKIQTRGTWNESIGASVNLSTKIGGLAFGNGIYVMSGGAVGQGCVSTDGANWSSRGDIGGSVATAQSSTHRGVTFTNGYFIINQPGTTNIMISTNGTTWTSRLVATSVSPIGPWAYSSVQGLYWNHYLNGGMIVSSDLVTFTTRASITGTGTGESGSVYYANPWWVLVNTNSFFVSTNGTTWTTRPTISGFSPLASAYGNNRFVVSFSGTSTIAVSTDTINWTTSAMPWSSATNQNYMTYADGWFLSTGAGLNNSTYSGTFTSTNGLNWVGRWTGQHNIGLTTIVWGTTGGWVAIRGSTTTYEGNFFRSLQPYGSFGSSVSWNVKAMRNDGVNI